MEPRWGELVVIYLYLGGLSAGLFLFAALFTFLRDPRFRGLARIAGLLAPVPVILGSVSLIFDLGSPLRFWHLFTTVRWSSPMSIGSWLLVVFSGVSTLHALLLAFPREPHQIVLRRWSLRLPSERTRRTLRRLLAALGVPLGVGVGIYTGVLLGAVPARPFWNTPMVAMLFLFSALSTAAALLLLISTLHGTSLPPAHRDAQRRLLYGTDVALILFEIFLVIPFLLHNALSTASQAASLHLVLGGPFTAPFWLGFVGLGLVLPLLIEVGDLLPLIAGRETTHHSRMLGIASAVLVLVGGYVLRWVFVYAGQASQFG